MLENVKITIVIEAITEDKSLINKEYIKRGLREGFSDITNTDVAITIE